MKLPQPEHVPRNYPGKSSSDSNYVTVRPRLFQLSRYISKFSSGTVAVLKFLRDTREYASLEIFNKTDARLFHKYAY